MCTSLKIFAEMAANQPQGPLQRHDTPQPHEPQNLDPKILLDRAMRSIIKHGDPNIVIPTVKILSGVSAATLTDCLSRLAQWIISQCPLPRTTFSAIVTDEWCNKWSLVARYASKGIFGKDPKATLSTMLHHCISDAQLVSRAMMQKSPGTKAEEATAIKLEEGTSDNSVLESVAVALPTPQEELNMSPYDRPTYDKEYVITHPNEHFYHAGGGMWKHGVHPVHGASSVGGKKVRGSGYPRRGYGSFDGVDSTGDDIE